MKRYKLNSRINNFIKLVLRSWFLVLGSPLRGEGFTLIELLIAISIVTLFTGITVAGYARLDQRQRLLSSGKSLESIMIDAQSRAYNSELDCNICNCSLEGVSSFAGWYVDFSTKEVYGQCGADAFSTKPFSLSSDVIVTPHLTPPVRILFKNSPLRNSPPFPSQNSTICVSQENLAGNFYVIRISEAGIVANDGGLVTSCTP